MSVKEFELDYNKYINYDAETNIAQCLVPECHTVFMGKKKIGLKRHYQQVHNMNIQENDNSVAPTTAATTTTTTTTNATNQNIHNSPNNTDPTQMQYSIKYVNDNKPAKGKHIEHNDGEANDDKGYRTFLVADYVDYNRETNVSKCLIKNCERPMSGRRTGNIKRHYHKVHNFVIVHDNQETLRAMGKELTEYYNNDTYADTRIEEEIPEEQMADLGDQQTSINFEQFIDYDPLINKSLCKVPGCKAYLVGLKPFSIKRHYGLVHNYDIESNGAKPFDKSKYSKISNGQVTNTSIISVDDLVFYDVKSCTFQCLFINCNQTLEKELSVAKRHYHEKHKIIIARDSDNIPQRFYRKRKHHDMSSTSNYENEFMRDEPEYMEEMLEPTCFIKNELLSDDEQQQQPHSSKRANYNLNDYMKERESSTAYFIKKENPPEDEKPYQYLKQIHSPNMPALGLNKASFYQLCLGLVIERDISVQLFDDEKYFKPLLAPYEQALDCQMNSILMEDLLHKANNIIEEDLKEIFQNKIVCLELYVLRRENNYFLIFNVRFLEQEKVENKVIGFLPINKTTKIIPFAEFLNKFNIDEQQVYMKTIMPELLNDEEIYNICNTICRNNANIHNHPIYELHIILRQFLQKYSTDIKNWQELSEYQENEKDIIENLKGFGQYLENWPNTEEKLPESKLFFKALQIFWNLMEKLNGEQYVAGDLFRDWLCCELELKGELMKNNNNYAGKLYEDLYFCKNNLLEISEFAAALYLDVRFNFLGSRLLSEEHISQGKLLLCTLGERFNYYLTNNSNNPSPQDESNDDEYALLTQHINDTMPFKTEISLEDKLTNCVATKREPFSLDILKYWHNNRHDMADIRELIKIVLTFPASQGVLKYLQTNFSIATRDCNDKFDKCFIKFNHKILEKNSKRICEN
ncbi:uncharacterized protein LOC111683662 [Lucilia cuprina]|uniref:uncharacterized protein LOC111683662 n=1 Tax=Lucilia cuprina TaxID=7375 RepID=UPI001F063351|nr:uncharacterized protein LOC111683662 [Lucilia cuprina]